MEQTGSSYSLTAASTISASSLETISLTAESGVIITSAGINLAGEVLIEGDIATTGNITGGAGTTITSIFNGNLTILGSLDVNGSTTLNGGTGYNFTAAGTGDISQPPTPPTPPTIAPITSVSPTPAGTAITSIPAEIKPLIQKINVLAIWENASKLVRNGQALQTIVTTFPTYEPCPEHEEFSFPLIQGYTPIQTEGQATYEGSGGAGNPNTTVPLPNTDPGANNTILPPPDPTNNVVANGFNFAAFRCQLINHEGYSTKSYRDSTGISGGIGHFMRIDELLIYPIGTSITVSQINQWFSEDSITAIAGAQRLLGLNVWGILTDIRQRAVADLCFNMGEQSLSKFKQFLRYMKTGDYTAAGNSLIDSIWFKQVKRRGPNILTMITQNVDPTGCALKFPSK
jgi:lysozyme